MINLYGKIQHLDLDSQHNIAEKWFGQHGAIRFYQKFEIKIFQQKEVKNCTNFSTEFSEELLQHEIQFKNIKFTNF